MASFAPSGISSSSGGVSNEITTPIIANVAAATANTEYSYALPSGTKFFRMKVRDLLPATIKFSFTAAQSGTTYIVIYPGYTYESPPFPLASSLTVYFQCTKGSQTVEFESWS